MSEISHASNAFLTFIREAPSYQEPWLAAVKGIGAASALEEKTASLVYIGILAAARLPSGIPFHVLEAKQHGATREEVISAVLSGLPAVGNTVIEALPVSLAAYDG